MLSLLLGLLLAGAEPSSHGFLTYGISSPLHGDSSRGYATNVVHLHANDSKTIHNHKVPPTHHGISSSLDDNAQDYATNVVHHATRLAVPCLV